jgi:bile acid-coenzyme A ligase
MTSGGSTGRPKLILTNAPGMTDPDANPLFMLEPDGCMVMPGPLYHNAPFVWGMTALLAGNHLVLGGRFDAATTLRLMAEHRAEVVYLVPTMMLRIWRLPEDERLGHDLSNLKAVWHLAAPCPPWLKQCWIDWLGPDRIWELYAGTEAQASTIITGREWLEHRGSVGRVASGAIRILDPDGNDLPTGEVGEVFMRPPDPSKPTYRYVGAEAHTLAGDGEWESLGDMGWMDADGYLYLTDRRTDMVLVGGANVYPAEVEAALEEHPEVRSCAVVGLPDEDLGSRLHAVVQLSARDAATVDELRAHLSERLASHKVPRSYDFVDEPVRDDAGKVRRTALRDERS